MKRFIGIGLLVGLGLALSEPASSAEKMSFFDFLKKAPAEDEAAKAEEAESEKEPSEKPARSIRSSRIRTVSVYAGREYPLPKDPNRFIVKIPQAPKPPAQAPRTDLLQKPEKREVPR